MDQQTLDVVRKLAKEECDKLGLELISVRFFVDSLNGPTLEILVDHDYQITMDEISKLTESLSPRIDGVEGLEQSYILDISSGGGEKEIPFADLPKLLSRYLDVTEKGKEKKVKEEIEVPAGQVVSQYARYFDECNPNWTKDPEQNRYFITCVQNMLNDRLRSVGHVFLNEAYEALGFKHSSAGAVVGWVYDPADGKDNYIDFNIFDEESFSKREFVNGYERSILLDFNVDGVIYDLI